MITTVVTSCDRHDLLARTLDSLFEWNSLPLAGVIVVEDGPPIPPSVRASYKGRPITWISTGRRVGQIAAIDYAYSRVTTPYIFHLEDDWEFYRTGFMERSLIVLECNPKCLQVWIRALDDTNQHPVEEYAYTDRDVSWARMALDYSNSSGEWHGFSFNPGLRRLRDYVSIGGYGVHGSFDAAQWGRHESEVGSLYRRRDFFAAILSDDGGSGYVRHIGLGRHVGPMPSDLA